MARSLLRFGCILAVGAVVAAAQTMAPSQDEHYSCMLSGMSSACANSYAIRSDPSGSTMNMTVLCSGQSQIVNFESLVMPADGQPWDQGVRFAQAVQAAGLWPNNNSSDFVSASWVHDDSSRADNFNFTRANGDVFSFQSTTCSDWINCPTAGNPSFGKHCFTDQETCCGAGSMTPSCVPNNSDQQCCSYFLSATQCNSTQTCCGMLGPGASSDAFCCNQGSTCCQTRGAPFTGTASCCPEGTTCCQGASVGLCCGPNEACDADNNRCVATNSSSSGSTSAPATTSAVSTTAATPSTTTSEPTATATVITGSTTTSAGSSPAELTTASQASSGPTATATVIGTTTPSNGPTATATVIGTNAPTPAPTFTATVIGTTATTTGAPGIAPATPAPTGPYHITINVVVCGFNFAPLQSNSTWWQRVLTALKGDLCHSLTVSEALAEIGDAVVNDAGCLRISLSVVVNTAVEAASVRVSTARLTNETLASGTQQVQAVAPANQPQPTLTVSTAAVTSDTSNADAATPAGSGAMRADSVTTLSLMVATGLTVYVLVG